MCRNVISIAITFQHHGWMGVFNVRFFMTIFQDLKERWIGQFCFRWFSDLSFSMILNVRFCTRIINRKRGVRKSNSTNSWISYMGFITFRYMIFTTMLHFISFPSVHTSLIMFHFYFLQSTVHLIHFIYHNPSCSYLPYLVVFILHGYSTSLSASLFRQSLLWKLAIYKCL